MEAITVQGAPMQYECGQGALEKLPIYLQALEIERVTVLHGKTALQAAQPFLTNAKTENWEFIELTGPCTEGMTDRLASELQGKSDAIIGIGGGTILDIAKAVGYKAKLKTVVIPTVASTCAAWTPLSVFYNQAGEFSHYSIFPTATALVLIEPEIIAKGPVAYLRAGIGDTLAKFYEAEALLESFFQNESLPVAVQVGREAAELCKQILLKDGREAIQSCENQLVTAEIIRVIEANILAGGMVGGFAGKYGRVAGAHSVHNGLTAVKETHAFLHGEKVAYGILVQLAIECNWKEIEQIIPFYVETKLPYRLKEFSIDPENKQVLAFIIGKALRESESIHLMKQTVSEQSLLEAILGLEKFAEDFLNRSKTKN
ncbi:iron-containing alcohol dehydrogenase family protein [Bacillus canaveralius]|uniref:iron-containing alcohol dehydrogenase family protein n=1 Tax=Bacillus canaveralius TaxID=1403243 RepID=UPI000F767EFF|nr:iron-containing alcohol dehydrogenase family protein [Bacillus canaveralius]RSK55471.1 iron-containing alcohol dehydrogenase family protein [Bacillus canaveralius]